MNVPAYGRSAPAWLASCAPSTPSSKTSPRYSADAIWLTAQADLFSEHGLAEFCETWPKSGMTVNGTAYRLETLMDCQPVRPTDESGCGLFPTPRSSDGEKGSRTMEGAQRELERGRNKDLGMVAAMWPTPMARDFKGCRTAEALAQSGRNASNGLPDAVMMAGTSQMPSTTKMWATPNASDNRDRGNLSTPAIQRRMEKGKQINLSMSVSHESGQLNPAWVCWLMGLPLDWLDLDGYRNPELDGLPPEYLTGCKS